MRCMERAGRMWALLLFLSLLILAPLARAEAGCLEDTRRVQLGQDHARLRTFLCGADDSPQSPPVLRVEFYRLSDPAVTMLFSGAPTALTNEILGDGELLKNDIHTTITDLVKRFGYETKAASEMYMSIETPRGGSGAKKRNDPSRSTTAPILTMSNESFWNTGVQLRIDSNTLNTQWNSTYYANAVTGKAQIQYLRTLKQGETLKELPNLYKFLISKGCTKNFVFLSYDQSSCSSDVSGCVPCMSYHTRPPIVDMAVIENLSSQRFRLDGMYGEKIASASCRNAAPSSLVGAGVDQRIWGEGMILAPGARVFVPLKLTFAVPPIAESIANADKARSNNKTVPSVYDQIFGPEWRLTAVNVDGRHVTLAKKSANFLNSTVSALEGSCPYLLAWNPATERWTEYGKILHVARSKDTEQAQTTQISGFRSKFRLAEREPEVAYIDHAELTAELKDGRSLTLTASEPRLATRDGQYVVLRMGELVDFEFKLPNSVKESDVTESRLTVFGYYEPIASVVRK